MRALYSSCEDEGKTALTRAIRAQIEERQGSIPPAKRRGVGAEILAYVQALMQTQSKSQLSTTAGTAETVREERVISNSLGDQNYCLISVALAVVEAMQRSPAKQFQQICAFQCSYDTRTAREAKLDDIARRSNDIDMCIAHLLNYFIPPPAGKSLSLFCSDGLILKVYVLWFDYFAM
jgi:hypothetical protein